MPSNEKYQSAYGNSRLVTSLPRPYKHRVGQPDLPLTPPPRLLIERNDIGEISPEEQPAGCLFLSLLPLELRQCIYELLLGGRAVRFSLAVWLPYRSLILYSRCYESGDNAAGVRQNLDIPAERIFPALLGSCRQVYLEALPILHQRNTFYIHAEDLETVFHSALGQYCLPEIRRLHLFYAYENLDSSLWENAFPLLHQMRLDNLVFQFHRNRSRKNVESHTPVLDSVWSRKVVELRNLRRFEVFFRDEGELDPRTQMTTMAQQLRHLRNLMVGPGEEERYRVWLEDR
ncbi:hypothetical protein DFH09DRAFT_1269164 [Mycena vulgaris]|nr:hypothetical protein DFH09DRAFT_1269164 [Mycena vulgaris]